MSFLASLFGADEEQKRADALDAQLEALNKRDYSPGGVIYATISERDGEAAAEQARQATEDHLTIQRMQDKDVSGQIDQAFREGLNEGAANIRQGFDSAVFGTLKTLLKTVPVSVWIAAAVFGFIYFGGWALVSRRILR